MPTLGETPEHILAVEQSVKDSIKLLKPYFESMAKKVKLKARLDILNEYSGKYVYIESGEFKLVLDEKIIRMYSPGDLILLNAKLLHGKIFSEFSSQLLVMDKDFFLSILQADPKALELYEEVLYRYSLLDLHLISYYQQAIKRPALETKTFEAGEYIIRKGDNSDEIYEMIDGDAKVLVNGKEVGVINESEIFGEISFFIGEKRTADVVANKYCSVNYVKREDFMELIKQRPQLIYNIAKSLSGRLSESNLRK